jgi:anthranilate/para-aminobenzoate synthase component I
MSPREKFCNNEKPRHSNAGVFSFHHDYNSPVLQNCRIQLDGISKSFQRRAAPPHLMLRCDPPYTSAILFDHHGPLRQWPNPLEALHWLATDARQHDWIGYLSYDLGRWFEKFPVIAQDDLNLPLFIFTAHEPGDIPEPSLNTPAVSRSDLRSTFTREGYESAVARIIDYIAAGDVFQVNLSQRFTTSLPASPREIYARLYADAPAAYAALLQYDDFALISNSPELFLRMTPDRRIVTRPIKGTRPLQPGMSEQLRDSVKDQAELHMIVDLERNDLGRVCEIGSVKVIEPRIIEPHATVYHGVATIEGKLRRGLSFIDLLRATFPGGSVTGAPKIRAMQIIEELEPVRRGPYCGVIGYLASDGTIEFSLAIRTMIVKNNLVHIPVGGGIVTDSNPAAEYEETLVKARAMFAALEIQIP